METNNQQTSIGNRLDYGNATTNSSTYESFEISQYQKRIVTCESNFEEAKVTIYDLNLDIKDLKDENETLKKDIEQLNRKIEIYESRISGQNDIEEKMNNFMVSSFDRNYKRSLENSSEIIDNYLSSKNNFYIISNKHSKIAYLIIAWGAAGVVLLAGLTSIISLVDFLKNIFLT